MSELDIGAPGLGAPDQAKDSMITKQSAAMHAVLKMLGLIEFETQDFMVDKSR